MVDVPTPRRRVRNSGAWLEPLPGGPPAPAPRPSRLARWRERLADRWRPLLAYAAIAGAAAVVGVASLQVVRGWTAQRYATERELNEKLMGATSMVLSGVYYQQGLISQTLVTQVLMNGRRGEPPIRFDEFVERTRVLQERMEFGDDPGLGFFRVDLRHRDPWRNARRWGSMQDAGVANVLLAQQEARVMRYLGNPEVLWIRTDSVAGRRFSVIVGVERDTAGRPLALLGHVADDRYWTRTIIERQLRYEPLLPSTFKGLDWRTARRLAPEAPANAVLRTEYRKQDIDNNGLLAIRVGDRMGNLRYETPGVARETWESRYAAVYVLPPGNLIVRTVLPEAHGRALVEASLPRADRWLLAAIVVMGALFTGATVVELRRQQALARARRNFVSAVSHELRTPLAHMAALSETLLLRGGRTTPEQRERWLRVIHREALRLGGLVGNVLHHDRSARALPPLERAWVDLSDVVAEAVESATVLHERQGVSLCTALPPTCMAWADPGAIRQVLLNLLDNAVKYGPPGQQVRVALHGAAAGDGAIELVVDDEGPGIAPRDRERVWRAFERVGDPGNATGGSGLGLSVVRGIARAHGGSVHVASAPGGGARFVVRLPREAEATAGA